MSLNAPISKLSRLNLPPLKVDAEGRVDRAQLDHFTRTIFEWGKRVDTMLEDRTAEIELLRIQLDRLTPQADFLSSGLISPWEKSARSVGGHASASAVYTNFPSADVITTTFTKLSSDSLLLVDLNVSFYLTVAADVVAFGVNIDGVDTDVINGFENAIVDHTGRGAKRTFSGLAAGSHTLTLRAHTSGAGTLATDLNDTQSWTVREILTGP